MIIRVRSVASIAIVAGLTFGLAHCGGEKDKKEKKDDEGQEDTVDGRQ